MVIAAPRSRAMAEAAENVIDLSIGVYGRAAVRPISPTLFGLFPVDINYALDGGLNANLVNNYSFDAVYLDRGRNTFALQIALKRAGKPLPDRVRNWSVTGGTLSVLLRDDEPGAYFGRVRPSGEDAPAYVGNNGYPGRAPGMGVREAVAVNFSAEMRVLDDGTTMRVRLIDTLGKLIAEAPPMLISGPEWTVKTAQLIPQNTALARLEIEVDGEIDLGEVRLIPSDHWGTGERVEARPPLQLMHHR